jgi:alpha-tubulin suppressor-like RCC1 family protein
MRDLLPNHASAVLLLCACAAPVEPASPDPAATPDTSPDTPVAGTPEDEASPDAGAARVEPACEDCRAVEIAAGRGHTCARFDDGSVRCWGGNRWGELGDGRTRHESCTGLGDFEQTDCASRPVETAVDDVAQLSARGGPSSCALHDDGSVACWGIALSSRGGGMVFEVARNEPEVLAAPGRIADVSDGARHTCVALVTGEVMCRGMNDFGQLGTGTTENANELVLVPGVSSAFDVEVSARGFFSCAITEDGVLCWGDASSGQLGDAASAGTTATCSDGLSRSACALEPVRVSLPDDAIALSLGARHACALLAGGAVECWGGNQAGQLGVPGIVASAAPVHVAGLGPAVSISAGALFTCAVTENGAVSCWGDDRYGAVGDGETRDARICEVGGEVSSCVDTPRRVSGIDDASSVAAGATHACALHGDGAVSCWGYNHQRQLGDGTRRERFEPVPALR